MQFTCNIRQVSRISASSGTIRTLSFQAQTNNDRRFIQMNFQRQAQVTDTQPGDRIIKLGFMSMWVAGNPTIDVFTEFGCVVMSISGQVGTTKSFTWRS